MQRRRMALSLTLLLFLLGCGSDESNEADPVGDDTTVTDSSPGSTAEEPSTVVPLDDGEQAKQEEIAGSMASTGWSSQQIDCVSTGLVSEFGVEGLESVDVATQSVSYLEGASPSAIERAQSAPETAVPALETFVDYLEGSLVIYGGCGIEGEDQDFLAQLATDWRSVLTEVRGDG